MTKPDLSTLASALIEAIADQVAARLPAPSAQPEYVDQRTSSIDCRTYVKAARNGAFPASKVGRLYIARRADVAAWLEGLRAPAPAPELPNGAVDLAEIRASVERRLSKRSA